MPAVGIERALADVLSWLDFFVLAARSGSSIELVVAGSMESSGTGSFRVDMARLAGAARSVAWTRTDWQASLATGHVYLRSQAEDLDLWPLVLAEPGDFDGNWKVSVMEGIDQAHRDRVADHDCLRYINTATGKRSLSTERVLGDLMSRYQERPA